VTPSLDYHALAPELIVTATLTIVLLVDLFWDQVGKRQVARIATIGVLAAMVPILTLAADGNERVMLGGAYVVDDFALVFKGFFLLAAYVTVLISMDYIADGDYKESEFYFLMLISVVGMMVMSSSRELITIFVALETISIPTYLLAGWRKHDERSSEASLKYFLYGALSSAVMLYGMSFVYGLSGSTMLSDIAVWAASRDIGVLGNVAIVLTLIGFAFKVSAVPFHFWAPDTYEGAPTPVTAFLSVSSKAGGFVGMIILVYAAFAPDPAAWQSFMWVIAAASMTVGNVIALRQKNVVRMLAYSSIAQAGYMLVPFAVAPDGETAIAFQATIVYILIYGLMNLGAFACVIAIARRTRSANVDSFSGLFYSSPTLTVALTAFLFSLAGIPVLAGWYGKFVVFAAVYLGDRPRGCRGGQLGDRVLLLRQPVPGDVVPQASNCRRAPDSGTRGVAAGHCADRHRNGRRWSVPSTGRTTW
jgi:NADH-quinone oxidoreductase subunit N